MTDYIIKCTQVIAKGKLINCNQVNSKLKNWGGSPGLVYWEETHVLKVIGSNLGTVYCMDIFSHIFVVKIVLFV